MEGWRVTLEVEDTGVGMDELTRQRCLEPFYSTKGPRGSGLGLAMVYGTMRRHEGTIEIESEVNRGTTVRLIFSKVGECVKPRAAISWSASDLPPLHILCVDDDVRVATMLFEVLTSQHHQVEVAIGGQRGIDAFRGAKERGQPFQVVITDLGMPEVDGHEIVQTVKREAPGTAVIMLTGWAAMVDQEGELPKGVDAILSKPPTLERIWATLSQVTSAKPGTNSNTPAPAQPSCTLGA
jgi:CheY-like chemotaxis protein